jgi:hypothetical protein
MMNLISKLAQKPTDKTIRITRVVFALVLILTIVLGWNVTRTEFNLPEQIKYILFIFPIIGLIRWIFDPGIFRKKIWKWTIFGLGLAMVLISFFGIEDVSPVVVQTVPANTGSIDIGNITNTPIASIPFTVSTDNFFVFYGFILMIIGLVLNSRNITLKNERHGEKVKKIRV